VGLPLFIIIKENNEARAHKPWDVISNLFFGKESAGGPLNQHFLSDNEVILEISDYAAMKEDYPSEAS